MREYVTTVTSKGRLTLPAAVRRQLRIEPGDRVSIAIEDEGSARLRRVEHDVRSVRGSIATPPGLENQDFDELIEEAMTDHADDMLRPCFRTRDLPAVASLLLPLNVAPPL